jgi:hypothetical protein
MASYRLFFLNDKGQVRDFREIVCEDDHQAVLRASSYPNEHGAELWLQSRCVTVLRGRTIHPRRGKEAAYQSESGHAKASPERLR